VTSLSTSGRLGVGAVVLPGMSGFVGLCSGFGQESAGACQRGDFSAGVPSGS
jgi:hypothetical protein